MESITRRLEASPHNMLHKGKPLAPGKAGAESSSRIGDHWTQCTHMRALQREGLVYKRKKVRVKHERGTMAWAMTGKCGQLQLAGGYWESGTTRRVHGKEAAVSVETGMVAATMEGVEQYA